MRKSVVANLGFVLQVAGVLIILPIIVAFCYQEKESVISLLLTSFAFLSIGFMMNVLSERKELDFKSSCVLVTLTFFIISFIGTIPYLYLGLFNSKSIFNNLLDSYFESISGYTTTGFSLLKNIESLPKSIILYRSLTQWIGGIGIVYLVLAFFYGDEILNNLLEAIGFRKTLSKIKTSMMEVVFIYTSYTILFFVFLYFLGLNDIVENLSIVFSSLSTGGFSPVSNLSVLGTKTLILITIMMLIGGISFYVHHSLFLVRFKKMFSEELIVFILIIFLSSVFIFKIYGINLLSSFFHVTSASSATGFSFIDISTLPQSLKIFLTMLMFIGGSSFSTSGGIKIYRLLLVFKSIGYSIAKKLNYSAKCKIDNREVDDNEIMLHLVNVIATFVFIFVSSFIFTLFGYDFIDSIFECTSAMSNVGLSTGIVNIELDSLLKVILILLMGIGRVEVICFLISIFRSKQSKQENFSNS